MHDWHITDEALREFIEDTVWLLVIQDRLDEPIEPWDFDEDD